MTTSTDPGPAPKDCRLCGACCTGATDRYVTVTGDDYERLGAARNLAHFLGNRCFMKMESGRCVALRHDPVDGFVCSIYLNRPEICRQLERGGPECAAERERKGDASRCF